MGAPLRRPEPWTPEKVIEVQGQTIVRLRQQLKSAEKMNEALVKLCGARGYRLQCCRALLEVSGEVIEGQEASQ